MFRTETLFRAAVLSLIALTLLLCLPGASAQSTGSPNVVISQAYGGGGNSGATYKNDFIEIFNRGSASVDLTNYSVQYASSAGTTWQVTKLSGTIQPGQYYMVQEAPGAGGTTSLPTPDATGTIPLSSSAFKVALVANQTALSGACPTGVVDLVGVNSGGSNPCFEGAATAALSNTTAVIRKSDGCTDTDNNANDFNIAAPTPRNSSSPFNVCPVIGGQTNPGASGLATPASVDLGGTTFLTVAVTPGTNPASTGITVTADLTAIGGSAAQTFYDDGTNGDVTAGDGTYSFATTVPANTTPGAVSLPVTVADLQTRTVSTSISLTVTLPVTAYPIHQIRANLSTLMGAVVETSGVVTGLRSTGFYIQEKNGTYDGTNSLAIFVYTGSTPPPTAAVGNEVDLTGKVQQYPVGITPTELELASPVIKSVLGTGVALPTPIELTPDPTIQQPIQFEQYTGMLAHLAAPVVVGPTNSGAFYATASSMPRPFREPGVEVGLTMPDGAGADVPRYDGNPEVLRVDMGGCSTQAALADGDTTNDLVGPLGYYYSTTYGGAYSLFTCVSGTTARTAAPLSDHGANEFTVASFNMYNFAGSDTQTAKAVKEIRDIMKMPDVIGVEEVATAASLQKVADGLNAAPLGGQTPNYQVQMGVISGSQNVGFLYRGDRVSNPTFTVLGNANKMTDTCTSYTVWDRQPFEMDATLTAQQGTTFPVTFLVNHLRSLIDVEGSDNAGKCARWKRQLEAEALAQILSGMQQAGKNLITVGDFNSFDFNDGYVDVMGTVTGNPAAASQVVLPTTDWIDPNLADLIKSWPDKLIYTYVENGSAQSIDHIVVNNAVMARPYHVEVAHVNADFPDSFSTDATRPERVSDHDQPVAYFTFPTQGVITAPTPGSILPGTSVTFTWSGDGPAQYELWIGSTPGAWDLSYNPTLAPTTLSLQTNVAATGSPVYVRLWSYVNSTWQYNDYTYTAAGSASIGAITSPTPSTTLAGTSVTFNWSGNGPTAYELWIGSMPGAWDISYNPSLAPTTQSVQTTVPASGAPVYVRLWSFMNGTWQCNDYTYTAAGGAIGVVTSPAANTMLPGTSVTFNWSGNGPSRYELWIGSLPGAWDLSYNPNLPSTTQSLQTTIPAAPGSTVYVRLWSYMNGTWQASDYTYTASN